MILLRSNLLSRITMKYVFIIQSNIAYMNMGLKVHVVRDITYVRWSEECAYLFK